MVCVFTGGELFLNPGKRGWLITSEEATSYAFSASHAVPSVRAGCRCDQTPCSLELSLSYRAPSLMRLGDP